jgi:hypothetical protein
MAALENGRKVVGMVDSENGRKVVGMVDLDNGGKGNRMVVLEKSRNADDLKNGRTC